MSAGTPFRRPRILPPVWLVLAGLSMWALDRWLPLTGLIGPSGRVWAWMLLVPGLSINLWAAAAFARARTGLVPFSESTVLVTGGLYRFTRNPMYLGMVLLLAGGAVFLGSLSAWLPVGAFAWIIQRQYIVNEERFLEGIYGQAYRDYRARVRRWL